MAAVYLDWANDIAAAGYSPCHCVNLSVNRRPADAFVQLQQRDSFLTENAARLNIGPSLSLDYFAVTVAVDLIKIETV